MNQELAPRFKTGVFKCSCCGHLIYAFEEFQGERGHAFKCISLNENAEPDMPMGEVCGILSRNYVRCDDLQVAFEVRTKPIESLIVEMGVLK
jgi:hypothetical protein